MKLTWYGHSAFRADIDGAVILIDPFFTGNPVFEGDVAAISQGVTHIVVTHGHGDHVGDTLAIAQSTGATVITNYDLAMHLASKGLKAFQPVNTGGTIDLVAQPDQVLLRRRVAQVEALQPHGLTQVVVVARVGASTVDARNAEHEPQLDAWLGGGLGLGLANPNPNPNQVAREGLGLTLTVIRRRVDERLELEVPSAAHICAAVGTHGNAVVFKARDRAEGRGQRGETRGVGALLKRCGAHGATWASSGCPSLSRDRRAWWRTR